MEDSPGCKIGRSLSVLSNDSALSGGSDIEPLAGLSIPASFPMLVRLGKRSGGITGPPELGSRSGWRASDRGLAGSRRPSGARSGGRIEFGLRSSKVADRGGNVPYEREYGGGSSGMEGEDAERE